jgi:hypothetical protein
MTGEKKRGPGRPRKQSGSGTVVSYQYVVVERDDGSTVIVPPGARMDASDPAVKAHPDAFRPEEEADE